MRLGTLAAALCLAAAPAAAPAAEPAPVAAQVTFLGYRQSWSEPAPEGREPRDWEALAAWYDDNGAPAARALKQLGDFLKLDPYGRLQLVRAAALGAPLGAGLDPVRYATALKTGWNPFSRAFFVADQVKRLGYPAIVIEAGGRAFVGLPTVDGDLNADTQTLDVERSIFGITQHVSRTYVLWDVEHRIGESGLERVDGTPLGKLERLFDQTEKEAFDFRKRTLPESVLARSVARSLPWPGGSALAFKVFPDAAAYLAQYPEHVFAVQALIDAPELRKTGLGAAVRAAAGGDEDEFITRLLRAVQAGFTYTQGPLRPALEILADGRGDCDELSLLLALVLAEAGYPAASIAAVTWESADHLGLALKPKTGQKPRSPEARRFTLKSGDYFVIDTTYYHKREDELITAWGEMNPENEPREASVVLLPALPR